MHITCNLRILFQNPFSCIDDHKYHARSINRTQGTHDTVTLNGQSDLPLAAHAGSINEEILHPVACEVCVNGVACRSGNITDDDAVFSQQTIYQRGFSDIRTSNYGDCNLV